MCVTGETKIHVGETTAAYSRWHQGPVTHLVLDDGTETVITRNHPALTHLGWRPSWQVQVNWLVLTVDVDQEAPSARDLFTDAGRDEVVHALPGSPRDFSGDGSSGLVRAVSTGGVISTPPWIADEGVDPRVDSNVLWEALAVCVQPQELGLSNWAQARRTIPDIDTVWPQGQPLGADAALGEVARDLPPPVVDHDRLSKTLIGVAGRLRLRRVDQCWTGVHGGEVFAFASETGAFAADSVVVGGG